MGLFAEKFRQTKNLNKLNMLLMKKIALIGIMLFLVIVGFAQKAKVPTIMVVPDDDWCFAKNRDYKVSYTNPQTGITKDYPDYYKALQNDTDLNSVITQIGKMFSDRGLNLLDLKAVMDKIEADKAKKATIVADEGEDIEISPEDELAQNAQADILLKVTWKVDKAGPHRQVTFTIKAIDFYTSKQISGATGTGEKSLATEIAVLLKEAVLSHIDNLQSQMQSHFDDLIENGREVSLRIVTVAGSEINLQDDDLYDFILEWMDQNTVKGVYSEQVSSATELPFGDVRIPMFKDINDSEKAVDAKRYFRDFAKVLKNKFDFDVKVKTYGLGEVWLVLNKK